MRKNISTTVPSTLKTFSAKGKFYVGVSDKLLVPWLKGKKYLNCSDEGEAIGIGAGYYLATGKRANVFMSADGFLNALNPLTSLVIPEKIKMNVIVSVGRKEPQHYLATKLVKPLTKLINAKPKGLTFTFIRAK